MDTICCVEPGPREGAEREGHVPSTPHLSATLHYATDRNDIRDQWCYCEDDQKLIEAERLKTKRIFKEQTFSNKKCQPTLADALARAETEWSGVPYSKYTANCQHYAFDIACHLVRVYNANKDSQQCCCCCCY